MELPTYECDGCGACCGTFPILASVADADREPRVADEGRRLPDHLATDQWRHELFPLPFHHACPFLSPDHRCDVYATRPTACRTLAAGDGQCQEARRRHGIPPLTASGGPPANRRT